jgi:hypothetical protein
MWIAAGASWVWRRLFRAHAVVPLTLSVFFLAVAGFALNEFGYVFDVGKCASISADSLWQPTGAFVAVTGAFFLGGLLGKLPHLRVAPGKDVALLATQVNLTILSLLITFAWWYETSAVASQRSKEPITQYIMCVKGDQSDWTLLVFIVAALIVGRWLWHRPGSYLQ